MSFTQPLLLGPVFFRKWRAGTNQTAVRLDGWCEGGLGQQTNDGGGCDNARKIRRSGDIYQ